FKVAAKDAGLKAQAEPLHVQLNGPAFRLPAEFEVSWTADRISLNVSKPARIRLDCGGLRPKWAGRARPVLQRQRSGGGADTVREGVAWDGKTVEWQAMPGKYELLTAGK